VLEFFLKVSVTSLFILNFVSSFYAAEGPVHHPDYYAGIIHSILTNRDLTEYHQKNAEDASAYLENTEVFPSIRAKLIEQILLEKDLKNFTYRRHLRGLLF